MLGASPILAEPVVKAVVEAVKIPVGVKLTPMAGYPGVLAVAEGCVRAGAKYLLTMHKLMGMPPPDIYKGGKGNWPVLEELGANFNFVASYGGGQAVRNWSFLYATLVTTYFQVWTCLGVVG